MLVCDLFALANLLVISSYSPISLNSSIFSDFDAAGMIGTDFIKFGSNILQKTSYVDIVC